MNCIEGNKALIGDLLGVLSQINGTEYCQPMALLNGSSIGKHVRHIYDFYHCLIQGIAVNKVDYASRERNPEIESSPSYAQGAFDQIVQRLANIEDDDIIVLSDFSCSYKVNRLMVNSTINRELMFIHDHAVHHFAIMKIGIVQHLPQIKLNPSFGMAPATVRFEQKQVKSC